MEKLSFTGIENSLSRSEMKKIMAGSGGDCSGNWTIHPACENYNGVNPNAIICFVPNGPDVLVCDPESGTNPQIACCG